MKDLIQLSLTFISFKAISGQVEVNPLSANITKWSNTLKQFVSKLPTNVGLALKRSINLLKIAQNIRSQI